MRLKICVLLFLLGIPLAGQLMGQPRIWMQNRVIDLGAVYKIDPQETGLVYKTGQLEVKNIGNLPLEIDRVKGDAFSSFSYPTGKTIAPGETGLIDYQLGFFPVKTVREEKNLTLYSNQSQKVFLVLSAQVFSDQAQRIYSAAGKLETLVSEENNGFGNLALFLHPSGAATGMGYYDVKRKQKVGEWVYWNADREKEKRDETVPAYFSVYDWQGKPVSKATFTVRSAGRKVDTRVESSDSSEVYRVDVPKEPFEVTITAGKDYYTYTCPQQLTDGMRETIWLARSGYPYYICKGKRIYFPPGRNRYGIALKAEATPAELAALNQKIKDLGLQKERLKVDNEGMLALRIPSQLGVSRQDSILANLSADPLVLAAGPLVPHYAPTYNLMLNRVKLELEAPMNQAAMLQLLAGKPFRIARKTTYSDIVEVEYVGVMGYGMIENFNALSYLEGVKSVDPVFLK